LRLVNKMSRYFMLVNKYTGQTVIVDGYRRRLGRMRNKIFRWAELAKEKYPEARIKMIDLTYDTEGTLVEASDFQPGDIREFNMRLKRKLKGKLLAYAWVAELQRRGIIHYHVLVVIEKGTKIGHPDKNGLWVKGMSRVGDSRAGVYYICSYMNKKYQKDFDKFPKGCRLFGVWIMGMKVELGDMNGCEREDVFKKEEWVSSLIYAGQAEKRSYLENIVLPTVKAGLDVEAEEEDGK